MNYSCSSNNVLVVKLLNTYFGQAEEFARSEILSLLFPAESSAECLAIVGAQQKCVEWMNEVGRTEQR